MGLRGMHLFYLPVLILAVVIVAAVTFWKSGSVVCFWEKEDVLSAWNWLSYVNYLSKSIKCWGDFSWWTSLQLWLQEWIATGRKCSHRINLFLLQYSVYWLSQVNECSRFCLLGSLAGWYSEAANSWHGNCILLWYLGVILCDNFY